MENNFYESIEAKKKLNAQGIRVRYIRPVILKKYQFENHHPTFKEYYFPVWLVITSDFRMKFVKMNNGELLNIKPKTTIVIPEGYKMSFVDGCRTLIKHNSGEYEFAAASPEMNIPQVIYPRGAVMN